MGRRQAGKHKKRRRREQRDPDAQICVQMGATRDDNRADIEDVKKATHDACIRLTGPYRRSGVSWMIRHGPSARRAVALALEHGFDQNPHDREVMRGLREWLTRYPEARLVIAWCEVAPGAPSPLERGLVL